MLWRKKNFADDPKPIALAPSPEVLAEETSPPPLKPFTKRGSHMPGKPPVYAPPRAELPRRLADLPGAARRIERHGEAEGKKLVIGREISLSGDITACDKLVVEGRVEARLSEATALDVAEGGVFRGHAEVDDAEICGRFEGTLTARKKLVVRAGGKLSGTIRYTKLTVEPGGEVSGNLELLTAEAAEPAVRPLLTAVPRRLEGERLIKFGLAAVSDSRE